MAGENEASVSLTANVEPWEKELNKAADLARGWGAKVAGYLEKANEFSTDKIGGFGKELTKLSEKTGDELSEALGRKVGSKLGAVLGTVVGPGLGTYLGEKIGTEIGANVGKYIDLSVLTAKFGGLFTDAGAVFQPLKDNFHEVGKDADETFNDIKSSLQKALDSLPSLGQVFRKDDNGAAEKFKESFAEIGVKIDDFIDRTVYRLGESIQQAFDKVQEPLAGALDYLQSIGVQLGLAEEGSTKWGDSVRDASDVGRAAVGKLAFAFGTIEGTMQVVGGYALEYIGVPYLDVIAMIYDAVGKMIEGIAKLLEDNLPDVIKNNLPAGFLDGMKEVGKEVSKIKEMNEGLRGDLLKTARAGQSINPLARGREYEEAVTKDGGRFDKGKAKVEAQRDQWEIDAGKDLPQVVKKADNFGSADSTAKAIMAGSNEANNIIARAQTGGPAPTLEKLAAFAATQTARQTEANGYLREMLEVLKERREMGEI